MSVLTYRGVSTFGLTPGDPLTHRSRTDARGSSDEAHRQLVVEHAGDQFGSTRRGGQRVERSQLEWRM